MFATSPQQQPYLGYPQGAPMQQMQMGQGIHPLLQQLMANPALLARLRQLQGAGLGAMSQPPYAPGRMTAQPVMSGAYSLR